MWCVRGVCYGSLRALMVGREGEGRLLRCVDHGVCVCVCVCACELGCAVMCVCVLVCGTVRCEAAAVKALQCFSTRPSFVTVHAFVTVTSPPRPRTSMRRAASVSFATRLLNQAPTAQSLYVHPLLVP